jgi:CelD/BcsL family acetyltransferase involved in cellulose biosynthesis
MSTMSVEVLRPAELGPGERATWAAWIEASADHASPYFRPEFALAADGVAPGARVAVLRHGGALAGFLPFQRRGGVAQPLAAPMNDYHGLITAPGARIELEPVLQALGPRAFRFNGLLPSQAPSGGRSFAVPTYTADVSQGYDAYLAARPRSKKFFKERCRFARALVRDHSAMRFVAEDDDNPPALDFLIAHKREQYRRTGCHDIFECGWTEALLRRLWRERTPNFGGRLSTLRLADNTIVAALFGLHAGPVVHLWFAAYDPVFARYGPGTLLFVEAVRAAAADPAIRTLDFGAGEEGDYKRHYADPTGSVLEGELLLDPMGRRSARALDAGLSAAPALGALRERLRRRGDVIVACETTLGGQLRGAVRALGAINRRRSAA